MQSKIEEVTTNKKEVALLEMAQAEYKRGWQNGYDYAMTAKWAKKKYGKFGASLFSLQDSDVQGKREGEE